VSCRCKHRTAHSMKKLLALNRGEIAIASCAPRTGTRFANRRDYSKEDRAEPAPFSKPTKLTRSARAKDRLRLTWTLTASSLWPKKKALTRFIPAMDSSPRILRCHEPARRPASRSLDPARGYWKLLGRQAGGAQTRAKRRRSRRAGHGAADRHCRSSRKAAGQIGFPLIIKAAFGAAAEDARRRKAG